MTSNNTTNEETNTSTNTNRSFNDLTPGDVALTQPLPDVELEFYGLADESTGPMLIQATVTRGGGDAIVMYEITDLNDDENAFIAEPDRHRNKRAEEAIREAGGEINLE